MLLGQCFCEQWLVYPIRHMYLTKSAGCLHTPLALALQSIWNCLGSESELSPRSFTTHSSASAIELNILWADHSPNGRMRSMYNLSFHRMPNKGLLSRCTGTTLHADSTSIFASIDPVLAPVQWHHPLHYVREQNCLWMPSFMLLSSGADKLTIILHFAGWLLLGITPKGLTCVCGVAWHGNGPTTRPIANSFPK